MSTLRSSDHVIVVGGGLAGWRFVEALRREGYDGALTLIGDEPYAPYDRPPLSKQVLSGKWHVEKTLLATPALVEKCGVTMHLGVPVTDLDVAATTVRLRNETAISGTHVVIATGAKARRLPFSADAQIHTVRSRDDVFGLNEELSSLPAASVIAIIGGGFIGAEVATSLHSRGFVPLVLEAAARPLVNVLGPEVSAWLAGLAGDAGIDLRNEQRIADVVATDDGLVVVFADGGTLAAAAVIVGAGAVTNDEWLKTSGLTIDNGVVVDENLIATERIGAIGDVARFMWRSTTGTELVRIEHWQVANDHAAHLARFWTGGVTPAALMVPYFWSDQYGKKIQMLGHAKPTDKVTRVIGSSEEGKWVGLYSRDGIVTGVVALSQPRALMLSKIVLDAPTTLDEALERSPWAS
jgi:NADPH-dependent 2,4-dienoyl-CoA reductase/sulfur reductase-like enzyme